MNVAIVFESVDEMKEWIAIPENKLSLKTGIILCIENPDEPDFRWNGENAEPLTDEKQTTNTASAPKE